MNIEIANRLQKLRKEKGYSQEQLAEALGLSRQAVSKWERAEASPDTDNLICLARLYGISLDELLATSDTIEDIKKSNEENEKKADKVHVSFSGIDVESKNGERVHVGFDGIKVHNGHVQCHDDCCHKNLSKTQRLVKEALDGFIFFGIIIAYIIMGTVFNLWHPGWIIFLFLPVLGSIVDIFIYKEITKFCYPVFITAIYLITGFEYNGWHPYWVLFLTIILFYMLFKPVDKIIHRNDPNYGKEEKEEDDFVNITSDGIDIEVK